MKVIQKNKTATIALVGNPNSGKTSLFNMLTGARQRIGNWPGVTVEKKEGTLLAGNRLFQVIDLPGIYSLGAYTEEERIAGSYILKDKPEAVINIVDAACLERSLYLTIQIIEMGADAILALNMADRAQKLGITIHEQKMACLLGVPVIATIARKKAGVEKLVGAISSIQERSEARNIKIDYGEEIEREISKLEFLLSFEKELADKYSLRWIALCLLEFESFALSDEELDNPGRFMTKVEESRKRLKQVLKNEPEVEIVARRYEFISELINQCVIKQEQARFFEDKMDKVLRHRLFGLPVFFAVMWAMFEAAFHLSRPLDRLLQMLLNALGAFVTVFLCVLGRVILLYRL